MLLQTDRLRQARENLGLTQRELGQLCGIASDMIHRYETGKANPSAEHLGIIAEKLGVSTDYLLGRVNNPRGYFDDSQLSEDEYAIVVAFRRESWKGVMQLLTERLTK